MMNKRGISVPILIWVVAAFILIFVSLNHFLIKDELKINDLRVPYFIDGIYVNKAILDYHVEQVFKDVMEEVAFDEESIFVERFLEKMGEYKNAKGEYVVDGFEEVEKVIDEDNVEFIDVEAGGGDGVRKKVVLNINVKVRLAGKGIRVSYDYKRVFEG